MPRQRDHEDHGVKSSTMRSESWVTETDEAEKQRNRKKRRGNRRLRNRAMNAHRQNLRPRVRRRCPRPYHKAKSPRDNALSQLGRSSVRPAASRICLRHGFRLPINARIRSRFYTSLNSGAYGNGPEFHLDLENGRKEICIRNLKLLAAAFGMIVSMLMLRL